MNHIVVNLKLRISKLLRCFIYEELRDSRPKGKVRYKWLIGHFVDQLDVLPVSGKGKYWKGQFWPYNIKKTATEEGLDDTFKRAVLRCKQFVGPLKLGSCTEKTWNKYLPLLHRIQVHFAKLRKEWVATLSSKAMECGGMFLPEGKGKGKAKQRHGRHRKRHRASSKRKLHPEVQKLCREDFRSRKLIKSFPLLPEFSHQWKHVLIDNDAFSQIAGFGPDRRAREGKSYMDVWKEHCRVEKVVAGEETRSSSRGFHGMIRTNGVKVCVITDHHKPVFAPSLGSREARHGLDDYWRASLRDWVAKQSPGEHQDLPIEIDPPPHQTATQKALLTVQSRELAGKLVIVVDGGRNPILTASYFRIKSVDDDGTAHFEPFRLDTDEQRLQFENQRPWWQRKNMNKNKQRNTINNYKGHPARYLTPTLRGRHPSTTHAHTFAVSRKYWREITGQEMWAQRRETWQEDVTVAAIHQESIDLPQHSPNPSEYQEYLEHSLRHFDFLHEFYGHKRWRRMPLDLYIRKKRAEGELFRRFYPSGIPMDEIVVFWGDGDYSHNSKGSSSTPKNSFEDLFKNGYCQAGQTPNRWHRPLLWLPGCETNTSQKCPDCHSQLSKFKRNGKKKKSVYRVLVCGNKDKHGPQGKIWER